MRGKGEGEEREGGRRTHHDTLRRRYESPRPIEGDAEAGDRPHDCSDECGEIHNEL